VYASSGTPNAPPMYPPPSYSYSPYYPTYQPPPPPPPPAASVDPSQSIATAPWATHNAAPPPPPPLSSTTNQPASYGADAEYDKFMSEMK
jgi:splicing factor 1